MKDNREIQNESLVLVVGSIAVLSSIIGMISFILTLFSSKKISPDKNLTDQLNKVLVPLGKKFEVRIVKEKTPNAFIIGPKVIFVTSGLVDILTPREVISVLLHEVWHVLDLHIYKDLSYKYIIFYLAAFVAISSNAVIPFSGIIAFSLSCFIFEIPYKLIFGRKYEKMSDSYASKYGYGDELISSLKKLDKVYTRLINSQQCGFICKVESKITNELGEHPSLQTRVENLLKSKELEEAAKTNNLSKFKNIAIGFFKK